jgi:hypothetical protein
MKMKTKEELEEELQNLDIQREQLIADADELDKQIARINKEYCELSPEYVKVVCPNCINSNLLGYVIDPNTNKNTKCQICNTKKYIWMKIFKE